MTFCSHLVADTITISVPMGVTTVLDAYRAECVENGGEGEIELDGDEVFKLWTDQGEEAYVIRATFKCDNIGHIWCGLNGCPTQIVLNNEVYETNRIFRKSPNRISKKQDGTLTYWLPDGKQFNVGK
jgi:hypothetical protein